MMDPAAALSSEPTPTTSVLVCGACRFPIVLTSTAILPDQFDSLLLKAVYSYQLDVLDTEAWCYSAVRIALNQLACSGLFLVPALSLSLSPRSLSLSLSPKFPPAPRWMCPPSPTFSLIILHHGTHARLASSRPTLMTTGSM
jgi:hypothetical protein